MVVVAATAVSGSPSSADEALRDQLIEELSSSNC